MGQRDTLCNDYGKDRGNLSKTASFPGFGVMGALLLLAAVLLAAGTASPDHPADQERQNAQPGHPFGFDRQGCIDLALGGVRLVRELSAARKDGEIVFQYSPESFTGTEPDFAIEIVEAVAREWGAAPGRKMIVNLPATVEMRNGTI